MLDSKGTKLEAYDYVYVNTTAKFLGPVGMNAQAPMVVLREEGSPGYEVVYLEEALDLPVEQRSFPGGVWMPVNALTKLSGEEEMHATLAGLISA